MMVLKKNETSDKIMLTSSDEELVVVMPKSFDFFDIT